MNNIKKIIPPYEVPDFVKKVNLPDLKSKLELVPKLVDDKKTEICNSCQGAGFLVTESKLVGGKLMAGKLIECQDSIHQPDRLARLEKRFLGSGLNSADDNLSIDQLKWHNKPTVISYHDFNGDIKLPESNFDMLKLYTGILKHPLKQPLIYLLGGQGCGKTHWGKCLVKAINKEGDMMAKYTTLYDLSVFLKQGYGFDYNLEKCERVSNIQFLIIDEFDFSEGKFVKNEANVGWLLRLLSRRIEIASKAVTILIGNEPIEFGGYKSINSRMNEFKRIYNLAPDMRGKQFSNARFQD